MSRTVLSCHELYCHVTKCIVLQEQEEEEEEEAEEEEEEEEVI
jgi:hypothetical protein